MKKIKTALILASGALCLFFTGCASLQKDIVVTTDSLVQSEDVENIEKEFVFFDAKTVVDGAFAVDSAEYSEIDVLIKEIDLCVENTGLNKPVVSRLYALRGLSLMMQGKKSKAKSFYEESYSMNKGDSYTYILGYRLGLVDSIEDENILSGSNEKVLLTLEQGLAYYKKGEYANCVAALDSAFLSLPEYYRTAYGEIRQNAWNLRNNTDATDDAEILAILNKSQISISDMILITQETTDLLYNLNGGAKLSSSDLFTKLNNSGYFDSCSAVVQTEKNKKSAVKRTQIVTRSFCARFLWNLYSVKKGYTEQKTRNSKMYRDYVGSSPIPDVDINSEDFDAILGVVENEIMVLPDGINFEGEKNVSAPEFNNWLQKF